MKRLLQVAARCLNLIFKPDASVLSRWVMITGVVGLFAIGVVVWGSFLNWGNLPFDRHDWVQEGPRYAFLRQALLEGQLPLHIRSELAGTDRFLSIPDVVLSPQVVLLRWLEPAPFVLVNTLLLYAVGFLGLLLLKRRYSWSLFTLSIVFLLFSFNGSITAHLAVGHSMWVSAFLLPFFVLLVLRLLEGYAGWRWVLWMALLQAAIFAQGGFHFVIWCLAALLILAVFARHRVGWLLAAVGFSVLLNLWRILPAAMAHAAQHRPFISGFFSVTDLVSGFITLVYPPQAQQGMLASLPWWEVDMYTGLPGFCFLLAFGIWFNWKNRAFHPAVFHQPLFGVILIMTILSLGKILEPINRLPLPLVDAERISSRFILLPLVLTLVLAGNQLQHYLRYRQWSGWQALAALALPLVIGHDMLQHARIWRVEAVAEVFKPTPVDIRAAVINHADSPYLTALGIGAVVAAVSLALLILLARRK